MKVNAKTKIDQKLTMNRNINVQCQLVQKNNFIKMNARMNINARKKMNTFMHE